MKLFIIFLMLLASTVFARVPVPKDTAYGIPMFESDGKIPENQIKINEDTLTTGNINLNGFSVVNGLYFDAVGKLELDAIKSVPGSRKKVDCTLSGPYLQDGTDERPFLTVQAAASNINTTRDIIEVYGTCTENVDVSTDNYLLIDLRAGHIVGNLHWTMSAAAATYKPKLIIRGNDLRPAYTNYLMNGIEGTVTVTQNTTTSRYAALHLINTGIKGDVLFENLGSTSAALTHLFMFGAVYTGDIKTIDNKCTVNLYAYSAHSSGSASIGGCTDGTGSYGTCCPYELDGVEITRAWKIRQPAGGGGGNWHNVVWKTGTDFSGGGTPYIGNIKMDDLSYDSYKTYVTAGSETITLRSKDSAILNTTPIPGFSVKDAMMNINASLNNLSETVNGTTLYVNGHRNDNYVETGSIYQPFKTPQPCSDACIDAGESKRYTCYVTGGMTYDLTSPLTPKSHVYFKSDKTAVLRTNSNISTILLNTNGSYRFEGFIVQSYSDNANDAAIRVAHTSASVSVYDTFLYGNSKSGGSDGADGLRVVSGTALVSHSALQGYNWAASIVGGTLTYIEDSTLRGYINDAQRTAGTLKVGFNQYATGGIVGTYTNVYKGFQIANDTTLPGGNLRDAINNTNAKFVNYLLRDGTNTWTGTQNANGFSLINLNDNSLVFVDGSRVSAAVFETDGRVLGSSITDNSKMNQGNVTGAINVVHQLSNDLALDNKIAWEDYGVVVDNGVTAYYPSCVFDANGFDVGYNFRCWYSVGTSLRLISSKDGYNWTSPATLTGFTTNLHHPTVTYSRTGFGNPSGVKYKVWYWNSLVSNLLISTIRYAESYNGVDWVNDQPITQDAVYKIITGNSGDWNAGTWGFQKVFYQPGASNTGDNPFDYSYVAYYDANTGTTYQTTGLAYSIDGKNWFNRQSAPVINRTTGNVNAWDFYSTSFASFHKDINGWHAWYTGGRTAGGYTDNFGIGYAFSKDGISWTKNENPIYTVLDGYSYRDERCYTPSVVSDNAGNMYMYYTAQGTAQTGVKKLGLAVLKKESDKNKVTIEASDLPTALKLPLVNTYRLTNDDKYERNSDVYTDTKGVTWLWYLKHKKFDSRTQGDVDGTYYNVYFKKSYDGGATWQSPEAFPMRLLPAVFSARQISFMQDSTGLHHLFIGNGVSGSSTYRLLHHFTWDGSNWTNVGPISITGWSSDPAQIGHTQIIYANGKFHMAFTQRSTNSVYYSNSADGDTWIAAATIHSLTYMLPKIMYDSGTIYVVSTKGSAISLAISTDEFATHTKADIITHPSSWDPAIVKYDGKVRVISAPDVGTGGQQLRMYTHTGGDILTPANWSSAEVLTLGHNSGYWYWDYWPFPVVSGEHLMIYYTSEKDPMGRAWQPGDIYVYRYGEMGEISLGNISDTEADALPRLPMVHTYYSSNDNKERKCIASGVPNTWKILGGTPETIYGLSSGKFYADNTNNTCTVASNFFDTTDKTHHAKIVFNADAQDTHTVFVFTLLKKFTAFESGNALSIQGKCDNGSGDGVNEFQITGIQDSANVVHDVSGLNIKSSAASLTTLSLTKVQIDALGGTFTAGGMFKVYVKSYGNLGDTCYINEDGSQAQVTY